MAPSRSAAAHCDAVDGPVAKAVGQALANRSVTPVLKWISKEQEAEVRAVFSQALLVRSLGPAARTLADRYLLETVVRLHRAAEGQPYTGLKPAGSMDPMITAAEDALERQSVDALIEMANADVGQQIRRRFARAIELKHSSGSSLDAGRAFVAAYEEFIHAVEALRQGKTAERAGEVAVSTRRH
jgi:hypothetical protein